MAAYVIRDTFFDHARPKKGPILSTFHTAKPRRAPGGERPVPDSGAVKVVEGGGDGLKALRYENTLRGNVGGWGEGMGRGGEGRGGDLTFIAKEVEQ